MGGFSDIGRERGDGGREEGRGSMREVWVDDLVLGRQTNDAKNRQDNHILLHDSYTSYQASL